MPSALDQLKSSKANLCRVLLHHIRFNNSCNRHNSTDHSLDFLVRLQDPNKSKSVLPVNIHNNNNNNNININISNNQASALTTGQLVVFLSIINLLLLGLLLLPEVTIKS
jgi:hypothetical protein